MYLFEVRILLWCIVNFYYFSRVGHMCYGNRGYETVKMISKEWLTNKSAFSISTQHYVRQSPPFLTPHLTCHRVCLWDLSPFLEILSKNLVKTLKINKLLICMEKSNWGEKLVKTSKINNFFIWRENWRKNSSKRWK